MSLKGSAASFAGQAMAWDLEIDGAGVTLNGVTYTDQQASVSIGAKEPRDVNGKTAWVQNIVVQILKTALVTEPVGKKKLTFGGQEYTVGPVSGRHATEAAWSLQCHRWVD